MAEFGRQQGKLWLNIMLVGIPLMIQAFTRNCRGCGHKLSLHTTAVNSVEAGGPQDSPGADSHVSRAIMGTVPADAPTILATSMGFNRSRDPWQPGPIFRFAFELAGAPAHPKACFVSTGTGDRQQSIEQFYAAFAETQVQASHLELFDRPNVEDIREHLLSQDLIWVDRGSLANLLAVWRVHGLDGILRECWQAGVVLGGESAGSLCWHSGGTTDSFGPVRGLNDGLRFLPYSNAVHFADRRELHLRLIGLGELPAGYATDTGVGLHFRNTEFVEAVADRPRSRAYWLQRQPDGTVSEQVINPRRLKR